jgi:hypothetical protein
LGAMILRAGHRSLCGWKFLDEAGIPRWTCRWDLKPSGRRKQGPTITDGRADGHMGGISNLHDRWPALGNPRAASNQVSASPSDSGPRNPVPLRNRNAALRKAGAGAVFVQDQSSRSPGRSPRGHGAPRLWNLWAAHFNPCSKPETN